MKIILFEDNQVNNLSPIILMRPAFSILCGGTTLIDLVKKEFKDSKIDYLGREYLARMAKEKYKLNSEPDSKILFLNAALVPSFEAVKSLIKNLLAKPGRVFANKDQIIGLLLVETSDKKQVISFQNLLKFIQKLPKQQIKQPIFNYHWQVITYNEEILNSNLAYLKAGLAEKYPGVFLGKDVKLPKEIVMDVSHGLIVINEGAQVLPFAHLVGPLYIGKNCLVREFTVLKYSCCLGDVCKVSGEVEATVMQGFANKNHYGFLGYSYLGEWVNLGAGTTNSNLKNNYSLVKMGGIDTGRQFLGCIIGDYSRTAINTAIYTGKIIGVNSHLYGTIIDDVPSFTHYAKNFGCMVEYNLSRAVDLQGIVLARRGRKQTESDIELLKKAFESTAGERKKEKLKKGKIVFR
jgi:glucose-1-phosphate thymidylyltransferase